MSLPAHCPLCDSGRELQTVQTRHVFGDQSGARAFFHCTHCDVRYQYPPLSPEEEAKFYADEFEAFMASRSGVSGGWQKAEQHVRANEATRDRRMRYLAPLIPSGASVLEVGCSSGFMLYPLQFGGHDCVGIEPSGAFREFVQSRGVPTFPSTADLRASFDSPAFDVILHFFVLEHIADPRRFLNEQLQLLRPGGKIVFEIPNAADPLFAVYDIPAFERFYWSKAHPWYFSETSLRYLLDSLGVEFEVVREQRYDLSNHLTWARDGLPGGMGRFTAKLGAAFDECYREALIASGYCDTLVAVLRRAVLDA